MLGVLSRGILRLPCLAELLDDQIVKVGSDFFHKNPSAIAGWGRRPTSKAARSLANRKNVEFIALEDGFLRSFGTGQHFPPLSLIMDKLGIYYDSTCPSALEYLLDSATDLLTDIAVEVSQAKSLILEHRLSKYNHAPLLDVEILRPDDIQRVLVIDQTAGDMSVSLGSSDADTFTAMLQAARIENPQSTIYVKTHPEVTSGRKRGYLTHVQNDAQTVVLRQAINPLSLIEKMDRVYVVTSTMGFEAVLAGKPVSVFGLPWYAGWGVTDDRQSCSRRTRKRSVDELFAAAYFHYARYLDPETHQRGTIFDVIDWLVRQKQVAKRCHGRKIAVGYSAVRRWVQAPILGPDPSRVAFAANAKQLFGLQPGRDDCLGDRGHPAPE